MTKTISAVETGVYVVANDTLVRVRATIGNGQKGAWVMLLDDEHHDGGTAPRSVSLGQGTSLRGNVLEVSAVMQDVQAATNRLNLDVEVSGGGGQPTTFSIANSGNDGDSAAYSVLVFFQ